MTDRRTWTEEEDILLKHVFETSGLTKWSHIARRLQEEHGVKGRNGKQCKQRYTTCINTSPLKEEWSYSDEQRMFDLHNEIGNKWAIIGTKLEGRSDNCVKNHFYSKLRKALRKINKVVNANYKKEIKEFKPNILYRIVEVAEENFKLVASYEKPFCAFSSQLKNELFQFSYDDEVDEKTEDELDNINVEQANQLIDKLIEFGANYKKKIRKQRRRSDQGQDLLTPQRYVSSRKCSSENEDSEVCSSNVNSSEVSNIEDISEDEVKGNAKRSRKCSESGSAIAINLQRIRTRAHSQSSKQQSETTNNSEIKDQKEQEKIKKENMELEDALGGLTIMEDEGMLPHSMMMKKQSSNFSKGSEHLIEPEEFHFFEDSQIQMRILPEMCFGLHRDSQFEENIFFL